MDYKYVLCENHIRISTMEQSSFTAWKLRQVRFGKPELTIGWIQTSFIFYLPWKVHKNYCLKYDFFAQFTKSLIPFLQVVLLTKGTKDARKLIQSRFESLCSKGEKVKVFPAATEESFHAIKSEITIQWPAINLDKTSKAQATSGSSFKHFVDKHVRAIASTFQVITMKQS